MLWFVAIFLIRHTGGCMNDVLEKAKQEVKNIQFQLSGWTDRTVCVHLLVVFPSAGVSVWRHQDAHTSLNPCRFRPCGKALTVHLFRNNMLKHTHTRNMFFTAYRSRVLGKLKPIPASFRSVGFTLDTMPIHRRVNTKDERPNTFTFTPVGHPE